MIKQGLKSLKNQGLGFTALKVKEHFKYKRLSRLYVKKHKDFLFTNSYKFPQTEDILFSIVVPLFNTDKEMLLDMLYSVLNQSYSSFQLCLYDASTDDKIKSIIEGVCPDDKRVCYKKAEDNKGIALNSNEGAKMAEGDFIIFLDHDDMLCENALSELARTIHFNKDADFIYSDELSFSKDPTLPKTVHVKPDFSIDNLLGNNYICHLMAIKKSLFNTVGGFREGFDGSQDHDLVLRLAQNAICIIHIPKVLYFWRIHKNSVAQSIDAKPYCVDSGIKAVEDFLKNEGLNAEVHAIDNNPVYRVRYKGFDGNYSVINNTDNMLDSADSINEDSVLFFINSNLRLDDESIIELCAMVKQRPDIGAAGGRIDVDNKIFSLGARLDRRLGFSPVFNGVSSTSCGYMKRLWYSQEVSMLLGFMAVRKSIFDQFGGFDQNLQPDERIADFCLRLSQTGFLICANPNYISTAEKAPQLFSASPAFINKWKDLTRTTDRYVSNAVNVFLSK